MKDKKDDIIWSVAVLVPPYKSLTYKEPFYFPSYVWKPGLRVLVPMGRSNILRPGVLENYAHLTVPGRLKSIHWPLEKDNSITLEFLEMISELSRRQAVTPSRILASVLPGSMRTVPGKLIFSKSGEKISLPDCTCKSQSLDDLARQWIEGDLTYPSSRKNIRKIISVAKEPPWSILPNAKLQWKVMDTLWQRGEMDLTNLKKILGPSVKQSLASLENKGLIAVNDEEKSLRIESLSPNHDKIKLSPDQEKVMSELEPRLLAKTFDVSLLHGVTGSGKTMIYIYLARVALQGGRSAIFLAPEIAIAVQLYEQAQKFLSEYKVFLHHGLRSPSEKESVFDSIRTTEDPLLLVGTRSALFMPVKNIGLLAIDEEHDESFKQDQGFVYQAKEIAHYVAKRDNAMLVLGSATPDIKTYYAAKENKINLASMDNRVGKSILPDVCFVDLKVDPPKFGPLAGVSESALREVLSRGEQAVIMHNRRGYSPVVMCTDCSEVAKCSECQVSLTYHKSRQRLVCHYCGQSLPFSIICSNCQGSEFVPVGDGTEKVEEFFQNNLADANVLRLDRDSSRNPARTQEILRDFARNKAQVLVGTQMLSKGHTFPNATLGIVIDGDLGLGLPDYRSSERIFQLLVQLSGRAGRGDKPGKVFIQTRNPGHYCWKYIAENDYQGFFKHELSRRKLFAYPPFIRLGLIRISFPSDWNQKEDFIDIVKNEAIIIQRNYGIKIMGPAPAPLSKLRNRDRYHLLIKASDWNRIRKAYCALLPCIDKHRSVRVSLDLDPMNML